MASTPKKRKHSGCSSAGQVCIIHFRSLTKKSFIYLCNSKNPQEKLQKLQEISKKRLEQPLNSPYRYEEACQCLPQDLDLSPKYGWHRGCYAMFTGNLNRLVSPQGHQTEPDHHQGQSGHVPGSSDEYIFKKDCIFCDKEGPRGVKVKNVWTSEATTVFDRDGWRNVLEIAEQLKDERLLLRIRGCNQISSQARYHRHCRLQYITKLRKKHTEANNSQQDLKKAHDEAFEKVCVRLEKEVIQRHRIVKLSDLCDTYVRALRETKYPNENYRNEKLKIKLEKRYGDKLMFEVPQRKMGEYQSLLVYSAEMNIQTAVTKAFELGSAETMKDTALYLRWLMIKAFKKSGALHLPPSGDLFKNHKVLPLDLKRFLKFLLVGQAQDRSSKVQTLVRSLGLDIMKAVTKVHQERLLKRSQGATPDVPLPQHGHGSQVQEGVLQPIPAQGEEELVLPQDVIDEFVNENPVPDEDQNQNEILDKEIFFQEWLDDSMDSSEISDEDE